jgi:hypothetical protein
MSEEGKAPETIRTIRAILNVGCSLREEPDLIPQLIRLGCRGRAVSISERLMARDPSVTDAELSEIQILVEKEISDNMLLFMLRGERARTHEAYNALATGDWQALAEWGDPADYNFCGSNNRLLLGVESWLKAGWVRQTQSAALRNFNEMIDIANLPETEQRSKFLEHEAKVRGEGSSVYALVRMQQVGIGKSIQACQRTQAQLRCVAVSVAVERYRLAVGQWPDSLNQLIPKYLQTIPIDPFDGQPLRYRKFDGGVMVYSVGIEGIDHQGDLFSPKDPTTYETKGIGLRVWNEKRRRAVPIEKH